MTHKPGGRYLPARGSQIKYYRKVPLFYRSGDAGWRLYKPPGVSLAGMRVSQRRHPQLFVRHTDRLTALQELQNGFHADISRQIAAGDAAAVKNTLCELVGEILGDPRAGTLQLLPKTVHLLVTAFAGQPEVLKQLAMTSGQDYGTVIHSVNVMALVLVFCFRAGYPPVETRRLALSALLHDVGKSEIPPEIIKAPRRLTREEFEVLKRHPLVGAELVEQRNRLGEAIAQGVREHHEKLDGSGYPYGRRRIAEAAQILGIIDCYEALTNEDRPYRRAQQPLETLRVIKADVEAGKFNREIFQQFCYSLV